MRNRKINLDGYGISKAAYDELRGFCLQHNEKLTKLYSAYSLSSVNLSGMPHGSEISDPTVRAAEIAAGYRKDIDLIEQTAVEIDEVLAPYIIKSVTSEHMPAWVLKAKYEMPASEGYFNLCRRKFYYLLAVKRMMI